MFINFKEASACDKAGVDMIVTAEENDKQL